MITPLLGISITIWTTPVEIPERTPFEQDKKHKSYDPEYVQRFWLILAQTNRVFAEFRSRFIGKASPLHPGAPYVARSVMVEAYSHEVSSCGFWPGAGAFNEPAFYAYSYPEPPGFKQYPIQPKEALYHAETKKHNYFVSMPLLPNDSNFFIVMRHHLKNSV